MIDDGLFKHLSYKPTVLKKTIACVIPSLSKRHFEIPEQTIAEARWLCEHCFSISTILRLYPRLNRGNVNGILAYTTRLHVKPKPPVWVNSTLVPAELARKDHDQAYSNL